MSISYFSALRLIPLMLSVFGSLIPLAAQSQAILNPGLNGPVGSSTVPPSWTNCGGSPDVQIIQGTGIGIFGINTPPFEGSSYLGLVSTPGYIEMAGQPVNWTAGTTYSGSVRLFRSTLHTNWNGTGQLRIWGGSNCFASTLLWSSGTITNLNNWQMYPITIVPSSNITYVVFENGFNVGSGDMDYFCMDGIVLSSTVLPINLMNFSAQDQADALHLDWEMDGLQGNERFLLEWSADAFAFEQIADLSPGISAGNWAYSHARPAFGMNYYRLRVMDQNGQELFSAIRQATHGLQGNTKVFPSPAREQFNFAFSLEEAGEVEIRLIDMAGRVALEQRDTYPAGEQVALIRVPQQLARGMYQVQARYAGQLQQHPIVLH